MKDVVIYTDGGCTTNPGPGGYGAVLLYKNARKELSGGYKLTTNCRMELTAVIKALECLKEPCNVTVYSDSKYVVDSVEKGWVYNWQAKYWKKSADKMVPNRDLWKRLLGLLLKHNVSFEWVKGHANVTENERCDKLAAQAAKTDNLEDDVNYRPEDDNLSLFDNF